MSIRTAVGRGFDEETTIQALLIDGVNAVLERRGLSRMASLHGHPWAGELDDMGQAGMDALRAILASYRTAGAALLVMTTMHLR